MAIVFSDRVTVPKDVLISGLQSESVLLNLDSECYFGLNEIGTRIFSVLTSSPSIAAAYEQLLAEYDVDANVLHADLMDLVQQLVAQGLLEVAPQ
jgi:hypothetical protein